MKLRNLNRTLVALVSKAFAGLDHLWQGVGTSCERHIVAQTLPRLPQQNKIQKYFEHFSELC